MMAAMMLPAVAPMVAAYRRRTAGLGATPAFAAGYLIAWLVAGLAGYALVEGVRSLELGFLAWDEAGRYLAGSVTFGGALYQLTGPKDACLRRCRDPRAFLARAAWVPCGWGRSTAASAWPAAGGSWRPSSPSGS
jgi:predicted metal-binding membrane protein